MLKNTCDKKIPVQAQANNLDLIPKISELDELCPTELTLVSQIIPFILIQKKVDNKD